MRKFVGLPFVGLLSNQVVNSSRDVGFMRGHGTYMKDDEDSGAVAAKGPSSSSSSAAVLTASVAGVVQRVNKLISVTPLKTKYQCEIGDVVVGRVTEVRNKARDLW